MCRPLSQLITSKAKTFDNLISCAFLCLKQFVYFYLGFKWILTFVRSLAAEWGRYGMRFNAIAPGPIETKVQDLWFPLVTRKLGKRASAPAPISAPPYSSYKVFVPLSWSTVVMMLTFLTIFTLNFSISSATITFFQIFSFQNQIVVSISFTLQLCTLVGLEGTYLV